MNRRARFTRAHMWCIALSLLFGVQVTYGYVASSTNYRIQSDAIDTGGGLSTSTNYTIESTVGEDASGTSSSATYNIKAGYQQMQQTYLAVSVPGNIALSPSIPTTGGGVANGQGIWTVTTDNTAGYSATLQGAAPPALVSGVNSFANYTPGGAAPDYTFSVAAAAGEFGFSPEGTDIADRYKDNGASCNTGSGDTADRCWDPIATSATTVALRTTGNHPAGTPLTLKFRAESGASNTQAPGTYTATATLTVLAR